MDTAEIEVFLVLAEELHFGRTAERLRLPQPRVSRLVAALERRAGGALFERTSRRVRLTPLGQQLASRLRPAYAQLTAALDEARAAARSGTCRSATPRPVPACWPPAWANGSPTGWSSCIRTTGARAGTPPGCTARSAT
jgi:DNA-binding transcriptional LysR family regulator